MFPQVALELKILEEVPPLVTKVAALARGDDDVVGVALFGSFVKRGCSAISDIDICLFLRPRNYAGEELNRKRLRYVDAAANDRADVQLFQQLPLHVRSMVLKEANWVLVKDEPALYELAMQTIRNFEDFRKHYDEYLAGVADAKP